MFVEGEIIIVPYCVSVRIFYHCDIKMHVWMPSNKYVLIHMINITELGYPIMLSIIKLLMNMLNIAYERDHKLARNYI